MRTVDTGRDVVGGDASISGGGGGEDESEDIRLLYRESSPGVPETLEDEDGAVPLMSGAGAAAAADDGLSRQLTAWDGVACNVSNMVGSGIFSSPGVVLVYAGSVGLGLIAWCLGALLAAGSALCYAELSAMMPNAGGDYAYLRAAFGSKTAFAWSWSMFVVIKSGSLAILGVTFATYTIAAFKGASAWVDDGSFQVRALAIGLIVALTWINAAGGVGRGARIQNALLCTKLALMGAVVLGAVAFTACHPSLAAHRLVGGDGGGEGGGGGDEGGGGGGFSGSRLDGLASATIASLWAFDGFNNVVYMAEELKSPRRDLPNAIGGGLAVVLAGYLAVNVGYVASLGPDRVKGSLLVVMEMSRDLFGEAAARVAAGAVALSVAGAANASAMSGGRFLYATARDGQAPPILAAVHSTSRAPHAALWAQAAWSCALLAMPGVNFGTLLGYFGAASWLFYSLTSASVSVLRRSQPHLRRPFRVPLGDYVVPGFTAAVGVALVIDLTRANPTPCLLALGFCALSVPVHWYTNTRGWPGGGEGGGGVETSGSRSSGSVRRGDDGCPGGGCESECSPDESENGSERGAAGGLGNGDGVEGGFSEAHCRE